MKENPRSFSGTCLVTEEFISPDTSVSLVSSSISSSSPGNQESIHLGHHASHFIWQSRSQQKLHSTKSCFLKKTLSAHWLLKLMANPEAQAMWRAHSSCGILQVAQARTAVFSKFQTYIHSWQLWWAHVCPALCPVSRIMHSWLNKPKQEIQHFADGMACMVSLLPWNGCSTEERLTEKLTILNTVWDEEDDRAKTGKPSLLLSFAIRECMCPCHNV